MGRETPGPDEVQVARHDQEKDWSCGAAALRIFLSRFGMDRGVSESELFKLTGDTPQSGVTHEGLYKAMRALGLNPYPREGASLVELENLNLQGLPAIVDFQAEHGGHYAVVTAVKGGRVHIEDPKPGSGNHYTLDQDLFLRRWFNVPYGTKEKVSRWLMTVRQ